MEVFHLDAKDHVAFDKLESMWNIPAILQSIECNMDIIHLFGNGIYPEGGSGAIFDCKGIVHGLREQEAILVSLLQVLHIWTFNQGWHLIS